LRHVECCYNQRVLPLLWLSFIYHEVLFLYSVLMHFQLCFYLKHQLLPL
jgi:hypothetical protein